MKARLIVPCPSELHGGLVCCQSPYEVRATDLFWGHQSLAELKVELRCRPLPDRLAENPNTSPAIIKFQMRLSEKGLDRLEADVPSHSLARARVGLTHRSSEISVRLFCGRRSGHSRT